MQLKALFMPAGRATSSKRHRERRCLTKTLLIVKLTAVLLLAAFLQAGAVGYSQTVTLSEKNASLETIFSVLRKQTGYSFFYNEAVLEKASKVSINVRNADLSTVLDLCFHDQPLVYSIIGSTVVIKPRVKTVPPDPEPEPAPVDAPPAGEIRGRVLNNMGEPLVGANVVVQRTKRGTITNARGEFVISGSRQDDSLNISFVGYRQVNIKVGTQTELFIVMEPTLNKLDQVVIQAYGTTSQRLTTGNIGRVTSEEIEKQPVMNPLMALQGRVAGLVVTPANGYAAGPVKVEIRGRNTINPMMTSDPLYVIDGIPLTILEVGGTSSYETGSSGISQTFASATGGQSPFFNLNPTDIESIEVLKDADATAIYGSRGANGVVLITTKKGKAGNTKFSMNLTQGISKITRYWNMMNTTQYLKMRREAFQNDGIIPTTANAPDMLLWDTTRSTNWQKAGWGGTGKVTDVSASLSGGDAFTAFRIGANYHRQAEILTSSGANQRANLAFSITHHALAQKLTVTLSGNYSYTSVNILSYPNSAVTLAPDAPPAFDANGNLNYGPYNAAGPSFSFPFGGLVGSSHSGTYMLTSSLLFDYEIFKGLNISTNIGYNNMSNKAYGTSPIAAQNPITNPTGSATFASNTNFNVLLDPQINYRTYIGRGKLAIFLGGTYQSAATDGTMTMGFGYTDDALLRSIANAAYNFTMQNYGQYKYVAASGRVNYNWENKYILNLTARRDGSSRFGPGRQFGNFGSAAIAWIATEEKWAKRLLPGYISLVKFRGSYGSSGNDGVGDYQYLSQWSNNVVGGFLYSYGGLTPLVNMHAVNQDYHWQVNKKMEVAMDLGFLKDRISMELAYYRDRCNNQLTNYPTPIFTGFSSVTANWPANVQNTGVEILLNAKLIETPSFSWSANFNIAFNRNKLVSYPDILNSPYVATYKVGQSLNTRYMFHYLGVDPLTGQRAFADRNHDGFVKADGSLSPGTGDDDQYISIDLSPRYTGGFGNQWTYKNYQLSLFFSFKKQMAHSAMYGSNPPGGPSNLSPDVLADHWQKPGDVARHPRFTTLPGVYDANFNSSDGVYTDASFIRLSNIAFAYNLPEKTVRNTGLKGAHLFINAQNIFVITRYRGIDPETQDFGGMPPAKIFTGGISFTF